jgi:hypothetical protein
VFGTVSRLKEGKSRAVVVWGVVGCGKEDVVRRMFVNGYVLLVVGLL